MPNMYAKHHDSFIETYLGTLEGRLIGKERGLPSKNKEDYL
jgi:hypothetical protein